MQRFIARRLLQTIPTVFGIMLLTFVITRVAPADPVDLMIGTNPDVTDEDRMRLRELFGLNDPLPVQFIRWCVQVLRLDLGTSFYYNRPALDLIAERLPNTLQLSVFGLAIGIAIGVPLGIIAALLRGRAPDHGIRVSSVLLNSTPDFYLGLLIILVLALQLRLLPVGSMNTIGETCALCWDRFWHMLGPGLLVANAGIAVIPRFLRTEMLEIIGQDYVRTARAKGLRERLVISRHAVRNALIPLVTLLGGILPTVVGGSVIVEQVFNWPGVGRLIFDAANAKDYPLLQASVLIGSLVVVSAYLLRDLAYAWVDPRIKVQ